MRHGLLKTLLFITLLVTGLVAGSRFASAQVPSDDEIRTNTQKYIKALTEKGEKVHVTNAQRIIKYLTEAPEAARGMYMAYKKEWDKILGWEETKSQKHLKELQEKLAAAEKRAAPTDSKSFTPYEFAWRQLEGDATYHLNTYCKDATDATCEPAKTLRATAVTKVVAAWNLAMTTEAIEFDVIQDQIIDGEREELYSPHVKLDTWIPQLAKEKTAYWKGFLQKENGLKAWATKLQEVKCITVSKKHGDKMDLGLLKFLYGNKDEVVVRCEFLKAPSKWEKYEKKPYWQMSILWAGRWEVIKTYTVDKPYTTTLVHWNWKSADLATEIQKKAAATNFKYPGNWARVQLEYVYPWIKEWVWENGKKVPVWGYSSKAATSVFVKWR